MPSKYLFAMSRLLSKTIKVITLSSGGKRPWLVALGYDSPSLILRWMIPIKLEPNTDEMVGITWSTNPPLARRDGFLKHSVNNVHDIVNGRDDVRRRGTVSNRLAHAQGQATGEFVQLEGLLNRASEKESHHGTVRGREPRNHLPVQVGVDEHAGNHKRRIGRQLGILKIICVSRVSGRRLPSR